MKYTDSHEWIELESEEIAKVGITDFAQKELGDIVFVELPPVGSNVALNKEMAVLESTKAAADIYSPVSGTVTEVNTLLTGQPEMINRFPEQAGWICKIRLSDPSEVDLLMDQAAYEAMLNGA